MASGDEKNARYKLCRDLPAEKGAIFEEWLLEMLDAAEGEGDEDASWAQTFQATDRRVGLSAAEQRRRINRNRRAVSKLLDVIPDKDLKSEIRSNAMNRPAGGPGLATDASVAYQVLLREMRVPDTSGRVQAQVTEFNSIGLRTHVGIAVNSISALNRKYTAENAKLPAANRFTSDQIVEKFLAAIVLPNSLATQADALLNTRLPNLSEQFYTQPVAAAGAFPAVPGGWKRAEVVSYFDEMWRAAWKRGDPELKFATATLSKERSGPSPRADGMIAEDLGLEAREEQGRDWTSSEAGMQRHYQYIDDLLAANDREATTAFLADEPTAMDTAQVAISKIVSIFTEQFDPTDQADAAYDTAVAYVNSLSADVAFEAMEKVRTMLCYKCFGGGHRAADCPSPDDPSRTPAVIALALRALESRATARRPSFAATASFTSSPRSTR